jgi:hypothetical protein
MSQDQPRSADQPKSQYKSQYKSQRKTRIVVARK